MKQNFIQSHKYLLILFLDFWYDIELLNQMNAKQFSKLTAAIGFFLHLTEADSDTVILKTASAEQQNR